MLFRFCLYGFLKNQRYFEPFLVLALLDKGLDFFLIGLLIAFREIVINLAEVPSGTLADDWGRRASLVVCFASYTVSFLLFGLASSFPVLMGAMFFFAIGDALRSGTHKSMIFAWLRNRGEEDRRTEVYGFTRSWSKFGSALSVVIGAVLVFTIEHYEIVFYVAMIPCVLSIINILSYPRDLEGKNKAHSIRESFRHLRSAVVEVWQTRPLRKIMMESMGFEGSFMVTKDYLQPVLEKTALAVTVGWALTAEWSEHQKTAVIVGAIYFLLYLGAAWASRNAHVLQERYGDRASALIWSAAGVLFLLLAVGGWWDWIWLMIPVLVAFHILQNFWRPILIGRIDSVGNEDYGATVMSVESQAKRSAAIVLAPLIGLAVDGAHALESGGDFWPIGLIGLAVVVFMMIAGRTVKAAGDAES